MSILPSDDSWTAALWTREQAAAIDRRSFTDFDIASIGLMEEAGHAIFDWICRNYSRQHPIIILAGHGNNGGDALVCARYLDEAGWQTHIVMIPPPTGKNFSEECQIQRDKLASSKTLRWHEPTQLAQLPWERAIVLDGILGVGFRAPLTDPVITQVLTTAVRSQPFAVIAIDLPSGLDANAWQQDQVLLPAHATITFGQPKPALVISPARQACGEVIPVPLHFHPQAITDVLQTSSFQWRAVNNATLMREAWPPQFKRDAHKFNRGHVAVIGGSVGKMGAPLMAAQAAARTGAGWITVFSLEPLAPHEQFPEITSELWQSWTQFGAFCRNRHVRSVIIGPGWTMQQLDDEAGQVLRDLVINDDLRIVFDAGALQNIGAWLQKYPLPPERHILTPHPGEWQKLQTPALAHDTATLMSTMQAWQSTVLYKSATPILYSAAHPTHIFAITDSCSAVAKAGMGDVLGGVMAGLCGQNFASWEAGIVSQAIIYQLASTWVQHHNPAALLPHDVIGLLAESVAG